MTFLCRSAAIVVRPTQRQHSRSTCLTIKCFDPQNPVTSVNNPDINKTCSFRPCIDIHKVRSSAWPVCCSPSAPTAAGKLRAANAYRFAGQGQANRWFQSCKLRSVRMTVHSNVAQCNIQMACMQVHKLRQCCNISLTLQKQGPSHKL